LHLSLNFFKSWLTSQWLPLEHLSFKLLTASFLVFVLVLVDQVLLQLDN